MIAIFKVLDFMRQKHNEMVIMENYIEYRYEETSDQFFLKKWVNGRETSFRNLLSNRPEWLTNVINIAKIGGHAKPIFEPPPNFIVWFNTKPNGELIKFIELEKE